MAIVNEATIEFLSELNAKNRGQIGRVLVNPEEAASEVGMVLPADVGDILTELREIQAGTGIEIGDPLAAEIGGFFNEVVIDGRFIKEWATDPAMVASELGIAVSTEAIEKIVSVDFGAVVDLSMLDPDAPVSVIGVIIIIVLVVVFVLWPANSAYRIADVVIDESGIMKP